MLGQVIILSQCAGPNDDGLCRTGTFHCPYAGTCIPASVRCDTLPNCGLDDNYDERRCQREDVVTNLIEECEFRDNSQCEHAIVVVHQLCNNVLIRKNKQKQPKKPTSFWNDLL